MAQWDAFVEVQLATSSHPFLSNFPAVRFKNIEPTSYSNFRQLMQLLDCSILDVQTLQYKPKTLVCSFMYLVLGK